MTSLKDKGADTEIWTMARDAGELTEASVKWLQKAVESGIKVIVHYHPHNEKCLQQKGGCVIYEG